MDHLPECTVPWIRECICKELQIASDRSWKNAIEFIAQQFYDNCPEIDESNPYPCEECFDLWEFVMARGGI